MAYSIQVGRTGDWTELPIGTEWPGWRQVRKHKLVDVPLAHGAIDVADGKWKAFDIRLRIALYDTTALGHQTDLVAVYNTLMANQTSVSGDNRYLAVFEGATSMFEVVYDKVVGIDVGFVKRTNSKHSYAVFTLSCHTKPYMQDMFGVTGA